MMQPSEELQGRILALLERGPASRTSMLRDLRVARDRLKLAVDDLEARGEVRSIGHGPSTLVELANGARPEPPAVEPNRGRETDRVALVEQLLDVERVIAEMTARRAEILEALR